MQKILLTRSVEENQILSANLIQLGFKPISAPMLSYELLSIDFTEFKDINSIIITSKFAARIIAENYPYNVDCFVVGEESANILRQASNLNLIYVADSAEELYEYSKSLFLGLTQDPIKFNSWAGAKDPNNNWVPGAAPESNDKNKYKDGSIIYFSGNIITTEFDYAERHIIYNVEYVDNLDENAISEIKSGVKYILLYSKNCATNLIRLLKRYNLLQYIKNSVVIVMAERVASEYKRYIDAVLFPSKPSASEILKLLVEYERERKYREEAR